MAPLFDGHDSSFLSSSFSALCSFQALFHPVYIPFVTVGATFFVSTRLLTVMKKIVQTSARAEHFFTTLGAPERRSSDEEKPRVA